MNNKAVNPTGQKKKRGAVVTDALKRSANLLLTKYPPASISAEMVLKEACVSRRTLYQHFDTLSALLESVLLEEFSKYVDSNIAMISDLVEKSANEREFSAGLRQVTKVSQAPERMASRLARVRLIAYSEISASLRDALAKEQERLTNSLETIIRAAKRKGWVKKNIDTRSAAVLLQAYTLGRVVDDVSTNRVSPSGWNKIIHDVVMRGILTESAQ